MNKQNILAIGFISVVLFSLAIIFFVILPDDTSYQVARKNDSTLFKSAEEKAIFIAKLNEGVYGFYPSRINVISAYLTSNGKYWIVKTNRRDNDFGNDDWTVTVNSANWDSKKDKETQDYVEGQTSWRSFNELKAIYVTQLYDEEYFPYYMYKRPYKMNINGNEVWKVHRVSTEHVTSIGDGSYVCFDAITGKSREYYNDTNMNNFPNGEWKFSDWITLEELDEKFKQYNNFIYNTTNFRDALRDLY